MYLHKINKYESYLKRVLLKNRLKFSINSHIKKKT